MSAALDEARAAESAAVDRRLALERAEREAIGYPEFDTPEWQKHQWELARRYHELKGGQRIRIWSVVGIHGGHGFGASDGTWAVSLADGRGQVLLLRPPGSTMGVVDYRHAYPYGIQDILKEFEILEPKRFSAQFILDASERTRVLESLPA